MCTLSTIIVVFRDLIAESLPPPPTIVVDEEEEEEEKKELPTPVTALSFAATLHIPEYFGLVSYTKDALMFL